MVNRGFVPREGAMPSPDMSFVRMFADTATGWQLRGQYAIWMGASTNGKPAHLLLERIGDRVAPIAYADGSPVFHEIKAGIPFYVEGMSGYWLTFDSDAMWLDTPAPEGRYCMLTVGGAAGKPNKVIVDWTCPHCGKSISPRTFSTGQTFTRFLTEAEVYATQARHDPGLRTCPECRTIHPPVSGLVQHSFAPSAGISEAANAE